MEYGGRQSGLNCCVVTPCYNSGMYLEAMLDSVHNQQGVDIIHIVFDGASTDNSVSILKKWEDSHDNICLVSKKDEGQADALNQALALVSTRYFGWLNADDLYLDGCLNALLLAANGHFNEHGAYPAIVYGDYNVIDERGVVIACRPQPTFNRWDCLNGYLGVQNSAALFNTELLRQAGGFDKKWHFVMDYDVILKLSARGSVIHIPRYCGSFRLHSTSKTSVLNDVCQKETRQLRSQNGVSSIPWIANLTHKLALARVSCRMAREGCLRARFKHCS